MVELNEKGKRGRRKNLKKSFVENFTLPVYYVIMKTNHKTKTTDDYKILAKNYEALNPKEEIFKQKDFFKKIIAKYSIKSCLDCACGSGWHLFLLNELGIQCSGSDASDEMLAMGKENLKDTAITLKKENFRDLANSWTETFDMVICMTTAFNHMLEDNHAVQALNSMYSQLNKKGILVIHSGISDSLITQKPKLIPARIYENQAFYFFLEYPDEEKIIFNILNVLKTEDSFNHFFDTMRLNALSQAKLERYFNRTKFKTVHYYGSLDFTGYDREKSSRLIAVAER